jgi:hypothetical protein
MKTGGSKQVRCAIYTRVSTDQGLEQDFNSLDAQYDASQAYIRSQANAGWTLVRSKYVGILFWWKVGFEDRFQHTFTGTSGSYACPGLRTTCRG